MKIGLISWIACHSEYQKKGEDVTYDHKWLATCYLWSAKCLFLCLIILSLQVEISHKNSRFLPAHCQKDLKGNTIGGIEQTIQRQIEICVKIMHMKKVVFQIREEIYYSVKPPMQFLEKFKAQILSHSLSKYKFQMEQRFKFK